MINISLLQPLRVLILALAGLSVAVIAAASSGCSKKQSYEEAMTLTCAFPERPEVRAKLDTMPPSERTPYLLKELDGQVINPEVRYELFGPGRAESSFREIRIASLLRRAKVDKCWISDALAAHADASASPSTVPAGLEPLQGTWHFKGVKTNAPADAKSTDWFIRGTDIRIVEGSRTRNLKLRLVAPCMAKIVGLRDDTPFVPFLSSERGVTFAASALGLRRDGKITVCSRLGRVIEHDATGCHAKSLEWITDAEKNIEISCRLERQRGRDVFVATAPGDTFDTVLFFNGDRMSDMTTPEEPRLPERN